MPSDIRYGTVENKNWKNPTIKSETLTFALYIRLVPSAKHKAQTQNKARIYWITTLMKRCGLCERTCVPPSWAEAGLYISVFIYILFMIAWIIHFNMLYIYIYILFMSYFFTLLIYYFMFIIYFITNMLI